MKDIKILRSQLLSGPPTQYLCSNISCVININISGSVNTWNINPIKKKKNLKSMTIKTGWLCQTSISWSWVKHPTFWDEHQRDQSTTTISMGITKTKSNPCFSTLSVRLLLMMSLFLLSTFTHPLPINTTTPSSTLAQPLLSLSLSLWPACKLLLSTEFPVVCCYKYQIDTTTYEKGNINKEIGVNDKKCWIICKLLINLIYVALLCFTS